jgi:hypothetical protein
MGHLTSLASLSPIETRGYLSISQDALRFRSGLRGPALDISTGRAISGNLPTETESHGPRSGPLGPPVCCLYFGADGFFLEGDIVLTTPA